MGIVCDDIYEKAEKVARKVLDDLYKPEYEKNGAGRKACLCTAFPEMERTGGFFREVQREKYSTEW